MKQSIDIRWDFLGAEFANLGAKDQAEFFKGFIREMGNWPSHYHREMQMIEISNELEDRDRVALEKYLPTICEPKETTR